MRRDFGEQVDRVNVFVDFDGDGRTGYAFTVSRGEGHALYVEPQAQLTWGDVRMRSGQHVEANGTRVSVPKAKVCAAA